MISWMSLSRITSEPWTSRIDNETLRRDPFPVAASGVVAPLAPPFIFSGKLGDEAGMDVLTARSGASRCPLRRFRPA